jgi:hypothetical protein
MAQNFNPFIPNAPIGPLDPNAPTPHALIVFDVIPFVGNQPHIQYMLIIHRGQLVVARILDEIPQILAALRSEILMRLGWGEQNPPAN